MPDKPDHALASRSIYVSSTAFLFDRLARDAGEWFVDDDGVDAQRSHRTGHGICLMTKPMIDRIAGLA